MWAVCLGCERGAWVCLLVQEGCIMGRIVRITAVIGVLGLLAMAGLGGGQYAAMIAGQSRTA